MRHIVFKRRSLQSICGRYLCILLILHSTRTKFVVSGNLKLIFFQSFFSLLNIKDPETTKQILETLYKVFTREKYIEKM